ncbi:MAG: glycosyltransferase family 4 protein [Candidatus Roizmanbacteria bacterium]|nr:glycosyltransferase family 4 protein [Candidatus Roizmanbacteria bacterium]
MNNKKKILILNWRCPKNPLSGGAEMVTLEHAKVWVKKGFDVTWLSGGYKNCKKEEYIEGVRIFRYGNPLSIYLLAPILYWFKWHGKFDLVIDEIHGLPFFTPLYVKGPIIAFIHEVADKIWDYMFTFPISWLGKWLESHYFKLYKNISFWTDADSTIEELVPMGIRKKDCIAINCPASNSAISELPKKEEIPTFIFVSRLVRMKSVEEVIEAFFYIQKELPNAQLWIVGDGDKVYYEELVNKVKNYSISNKVTFYGRVSNEKKLELMKRSHVHLLGIKVHAGWCLVVIEAASQGTPSVVYYTSGLRDAVKNDKTGIVLQQNNPKEMAKQAVLLFKNKERYILFQNAGLLWAKSLTWEKATEQSLKLIESKFNV